MRQVTAEHAGIGQQSDLADPPHGMCRCLAELKSRAEPGQLERDQSTVPQRSEDGVNFAARIRIRRNPPRPSLTASGNRRGAEPPRRDPFSVGRRSLPDEAEPRSICSAKSSAVLASGRASAHKWWGARGSDTARSSPLLHAKDPVAGFIASRYHVGEHLKVDVS